jgi:hypothetical protein
MALNVWDNQEQTIGFVLCLIFAPVSVLATILRFVATRRFNRPYGWDDWHALIAEIIFLAYCAYALWAFAMINGRPISYVIQNHMPLFQEVIKAGNIMNGVYGFQQSFVKFSLLALYQRLFWVNKTFSISVWVVAIIQGCWGLVVFLVHIFACRPIEKVWTPLMDGYCIDENIFFSIYEPLNSLLDFVVAGQALWMLPSLQTRRTTRWHLAILFLIGAFSGVIGIIKVVEAQNAAQANFKSVIWNIVQMATSIICCCAPIYQSILPKRGLYNVVYSWASTTFGSASRKSSQGASTARAGTFNSQKSNKLSQRAPWTNLDGASERGLAWAEVDAEGRKEREMNDDDSRDNIPMGSVRVERSVDVV